jgi:N-acyl-D-aspartate/D-glutamate deacylase
MISSSVQRERPNGSDILFVSATIITGDDDAEPYVADLLVSDGLIKYIGSISTDDLLPGTTQIDATGCCLSPGFIDLHAHSDLYLLTKPDHEAKISQGCTVSTLDLLNYVRLLWL